MNLAPMSSIWKISLSICRFHTSSTKYHSAAVLTFENILSKENEERCKKQMLDILPVRKLSWMKEKRDVTQAAVLVPLCTVDGVPSVLLTKRSQKLASHRGQVSFPGGKVDMSDTDRMDTAIREAEEEVGLDPSRVNVWGSMHPVPGKDFKTAVTPVLAFCGEIDVKHLTLNKHEVAKAFTYRIQDLCNPETCGYTHFRGLQDFRSYRLPVFTHGHHRIWGLSAVILHMALTLMGPKLYTFQFSYTYTGGLVPQR